MTMSGLILPRGLGWRVDLERRSILRASAKLLRFSSGFVIPREVDHRYWLIVHDQGQMGSCSGQSRTTCTEILNWLDTGGEVLQLSRMFAYLCNQKADGINGDSGATIEGALRAAREYGDCREELFPYPSSYTSHIPPECFAEAKEHRLKSYTLLDSYDATFAFLASGAGPVYLGMAWVSSFANAAGATIEDFSGQTFGGHAVAITGYTSRKSPDGRNYLILTNSHGKGWAKDGHAEVSPAAWDKIIRHQWTVAAGVSDMEEFGPREYRLI